MSLKLLCVIGRGRPPSGLVTKMWARPSGRESKAICRLSGDQWGLPVSAPPNDVSWAGPEPSAEQTQISCAPERHDWNAMCLPSGEYWGAESCSLELSN